MKQILISLVAAAMLLGANSCALIPTIAGVGLYSKIEQPAVQLAVSTDPGAKWDKQGKSKCDNILGLVVMGNCGVDEAIRDGSISKVHHIDFEIVNILGLYSSITTIVYGE